MSILRKESGELVATGPVVHDGAHNGAEPAAIYDYIRLEDEGGREIYMERVMVPAFLDSLIDVGTKGKFYIVEVRLPKLFGSKSMHFIYAINVNGKVRKAVEQTQRCLRSVKGGAIKLFGYGCVLLIAWGFGLLLWIQAFRLMRVSLPLADMRDEPA